jgi:hypothetical protein
MKVKTIDPDDAGFEAAACSRTFVFHVYYKGCSGLMAIPSDWVIV